MSQFDARRFQAPNIEASQLGMRGPSMAGLQRSQRPGNASQLVQALNIGLATTMRTLRQVKEIRSVEVGLGVETGAMELPAFATEIESDDPAWEISVWEEGPNGQLVARDSGAIRGEILERFTPYLEGKSDSYRKGFLDRVLPGVERGLYGRGLQRRQDYLDMQLDTMGQGIYGEVAQADRLFAEGGDPTPLMSDYIDRVSGDIIEMFPQQADEPDAAYQTRIDDLVFDKVITPHVESLIGTAWGMRTLADFQSQVPAGKIGDLRDEVQRSYYQYLHERLATLQTGAEASFDLLDVHGEPITISSQQDMQAFLTDPKILDQDHILSLTAAQRSTLLGSFTAGKTRKDEQLRTFNAMQGIGLPGDSRSQFDALAGMNLYDPDTGYIGGSSPAAAGILLGTMRYPAPQVATGLLQQAMARDATASDNAIQTMIILAAHPDRNAFTAVAEQASTPQERHLVAIIGSHTEGSVLFDMNGQPTVDNNRLQKILDRVRTTPISDQGPEYTQKDIDAVAPVLGFTGFRPENEVRDHVMGILKEHAGADGWILGPDLIVSDPTIMASATGYFIENAMIVGRRLQGASPDQVREQASKMTMHQLGAEYDRITLGDGDVALVPRMGLHPDQRFLEDGQQIILDALKSRGIDEYFTARPSINGEGWVPMDQFGDDLLGPGEYIDFADAREETAVSDGTAQTRKADGWIRTYINTAGTDAKGGTGFMP